MLANPRGLLLFRDELAGWVGALEKYGGTGSDRAFYIEGVRGAPLRGRSGQGCRPDHHPGAAVTIAGGINPDKLNTMILCSEDDGLAARFLYGWPEPVPPRETAP